VFVEIGQPGFVYARIWKNLAEGLYGTLILTRLDRVGRHGDAIENALNAAYREGWRLFAPRSCVDTGKRLDLILKAEQKSAPVSE
jgi:hypothetical protein